MNALWLGLLVLSISALLIGVVRCLLFIVAVDGYSMYPTLQPEDWLLVLHCWSTQWLRQGQVVVTRFVQPARNSDDYDAPESFPFLPSSHLPARSRKSIRAERLMVKRIAALPGDTLLTHLAEVPEPLRPRMKSMHNAQGYRVWHIPSGKCFIRGDSPGYDSVIMGPIPLEQIRGIVLVRFPRKSPSSTSVTTQSRP